MDKIVKALEKIISREGQDHLEMTNPENTPGIGKVPDYQPWSTGR